MSELTGTGRRVYDAAVAALDLSGGSAVSDEVVLGHIDVPGIHLGIVRQALVDLGAKGHLDVLPKLDAERNVKGALVLGVARPS